MFNKEKTKVINLGCRLNFFESEVINGILSCKLLVSDVSVCTSDGKTEEYFGASVTSSNVSASFIGPMSLYIRFYIN